MSRAYDDNHTLQQKIIRGANVLADNVASTLGPRGRNVLLQEKGHSPFITKDGVTVAAFVAMDDPFENAGAQILRQAATETNSTAGDGTTTSIVLARAILHEARRVIVSGVSPIDLQRGIDAAVREVSGNLVEMSVPVASTEDIEHIATISANNDKTIGRLIALAVDRVGQDGSITIEESRSHDTTLDITEGFKINAGYCAGAFVTDERRAFMHHDNPLFLITDHKIGNVEQILPILEMVSRESRPLIIIAEDLEGQALAAMIMNAMRGSLKIAGIKAPAYGEERREILSDLALSVGAVFVSRESGQKLTDVRLSDLGSSKFVESSKYATTVVGGSCDFEAVENTIAALKAQIEQTDDLKACERLQDRIVRLSSGVAVIHVGGSTEVEMTERKHRIEDALEAVRSAQEQGIVAGGGTALLRASHELLIDGEESGERYENLDQTMGATIVQLACEAPLRQMALNAGISSDISIEKVRSSSRHEGIDFRTGELINMLEAGIIDPVKVTLAALQNAASCAGTLITTNYGIVQTE